MNANIIGDFIRKLREEKDISQQKLADMIPVDRSVLSKWERGVVIPPIDKMKKLCDFFDITLDELISGERVNRKNKAEQQTKLFEFITDKDRHYRKAKIIAIIFSILLVVLLLLSYYFFQTYNSEKIYKVYVDSNKYNITDGLLVVTRERTYLKIGSINSQIMDITLIYNDGKNDNVMYYGSSDSTLIDYTGYNALINFNNFDEVSNNIYIKIDGELFKLLFREEYKNKNVIQKEYSSIDLTNHNNQLDDSSIPTKIKDTFDCDDTLCKLVLGNVLINYSVEDQILYIRDKEVYIEFDINSNSFDYTSPKLSFTLDSSGVDCVSGNCNNYQKEYNKYYNSYIKKYIN